MTITKETFVDLQEKYNKVTKLLEDSKSDPENEPYLSKYSARQILIGMRANIENLLRSHSVEDVSYKKLTGMLATVYLYLGIIAIETEEISTGKIHLEKCKEIIDNYELDPETILITLNVYNQLGLVLAQNEPEESKAYLEKAENLYMEYKKTGHNPLDISDMFQPNLESYSTQIAMKNFEKLHTFTLYYLAQIYGTLKDALKSAVYCHITLQRQLEMDDYDPIDWALNAATLSQFFMEKNAFKQARHHLASSSCILDEYKKKLNNISEENETRDALMETYKHRSADVARCWIKYGIMLLSKSKERLLNHTDDPDHIKCSLSTDFADLQIDVNEHVSQYDPKKLYFKDIDTSQYENQITDQFILTLPDAKKIFLNSQQWSQKAQEYYSLESLASDFIEIVLDQTQLYFNLVFFEDNPENQAKLHKRRIKLLEHVLSNVNPQYYLHYCRQVWFELGTTYVDIWDIKRDKLRETNDRPTPQSLSKINNIAENGILHYSNFINSFQDKATGKLPSKIPDDVEKPFLQAYFHKAALYGRFISLDKEIQLKNTQLSLENYKFIFEYCGNNPKAKELSLLEYGICKEMVELLPIKIQKLKNS